MRTSLEYMYTCMTGLFITCMNIDILNIYFQKDTRNCGRCPFCTYVYISIYFHNFSFKKVTQTKCACKRDTCSIYKHHLLHSNCNMIYIKKKQRLFHHRIHITTILQCISEWHTHASKMPLKVSLIPFQPEKKFLS